MWVLDCFFNLVPYLFVPFTLQSLFDCLYLFIFVFCFGLLWDSLEGAFAKNLLLVFLGLLFECMPIEVYLPVPLLIAAQVF